MSKSLSELPRLPFAPLLLVSLTLLTGCGGFSASKSISPLDFLLPGLLNNDRPVPMTPDNEPAQVCLDSSLGLPSIARLSIGPDCEPVPIEE